MREAGAINKPHERRQKEKMTAARSETFPSASNPQRASSGQAINHQRSYSFLSCPTHLDQGANAGDASLQALGALLVKIQPSLSSLLQDLANWDAARSLSAPNFDKPQETSSLAKTSQEELEQIVSEEPSPTDLTRSETFPSASHPQRFSPGEAINQQKISSFPSFPTHLDQGASSSLNAGTSQGGSVEIDVEEPSPSKDFEYQTNGSEYAWYGPLVQACRVGDWPAAEAFLEKFPTYVRASITINGSRALHIAVAHQHTSFIKKLLKLMGPEDLELKTNYGSTALHNAAQVGNVRIAEQLLKINDKPLSIGDIYEDTPLIVAAYFGHTNMVSYLFSLSSTSFEQLTQEKRIELLHHTIRNDMYDIALEILNKNSNIADADTEGKWEALEMLANKPFSIGSESQLSFWKSLLKYSCFKGIYNKAFMKASAHQLVERLLRKDGNPDALILSKFAQNDMALIFEAARAGNVEFLIIISHSYPNLIWKLDENNMSIFHIAILYRQESVFNLIYEIGAHMRRLASSVSRDWKENMLHLAGKLAPSDRLNIVSGSALQMQREMLWFKEIEKIVPRSYVNNKNTWGQTPKEIFVKEHQDLKSDAEMWMKNTSNNCMVVATLIAAIVFAAAFTVPGGNTQEKGTPIFLRHTWFTVFFISNTIALFSSTSSMLFFMSVFVSRYSEEDFSMSVPSKLLLGLATLLISIVCMIVAFSAACILMYKSASSWAPVVASASVGIPLTLFSMGHCHELFVDLFVSQYQSRFLFGRPYKPILFLRKMPIDQEWIDRKYEMQIRRKGSKIVEDSRDVEH